jgi:xanthosine utilization system XapX-like protein
MDGMGGGFAISFVCVMLAITGIIVIIIYSGRARLLNRILNGENSLAHWRYSPEEWRTYTEKEYKEEKAMKKGLFLMVAGIALLIGIIFFIVNHEAGAWVFMAMLGLIAIIGFTAWFTSWYNYRQNNKYLGETYITENAVYINRQLHTWQGLGAVLDSVNLDQRKTQNILQFVYSAPTRTGMQEYRVNVPVPAGQEAEAKTIWEHFSKA